tara:strand:- start:305 stop:571 length:267 start_codon:yes stop_codon:yes gene_type:complete
MKLNNDTMSTINKFTSLLEEAVVEGTIGVEEDKLVTNTLKRPQFYRTLIKDHLERLDKTYTPKTYTLFEELYEHTASDEHIALEINEV